MGQKAAKGHSARKSGPIGGVSGGAEPHPVFLGLSPGCMLENVPSKSPNPHLQSYFPMLIPGVFRRPRRSAGVPARGFTTALLAAVVSLAMVSGCSRLRPKPPAQYVYVTAKQ